MNLCVIPARGGSKRILRKNIRPFHGQAMISWSIRTALESGVFDHVVVSTDDSEVASIGRESGAEVPFIRPACLADDHTPTVPVIVHALEEAEKLWGQQNRICCLYATAPFVQARDIRAALSLLDNPAALFAMPVTTFPFPVQRGLRLHDTGHIEMLQPEHVLTRSQDLEEVYHDAGQFYWGHREGWLSGKPLLGPDTLALHIPRHRVQDIDTPEDWELAERLFTAFSGS